MKQRKLDGHMDQYLQLRLFLSEKDINDLENEGELIGRITKSAQSISGKVFATGTRRLRVYLCDEDFPRDDELRPYRGNPISWGYEIYIGKRRLEQIKAGKMRDGFSPRIWLRHIMVSLEGVI